jgi:beta-lactamase regulating signal transducer with metallopeptidase domain
MRASWAPAGGGERAIELRLQGEDGVDATSRSGAAGANASGGPAIATLLRIAAVCWIAGVSLSWLRLGLAAAHALRLPRRGTTAAPSELEARARELARRLGVARLRVLVSPRIDVPCVVGVLRPVVLVPAATLTGIPAAQLEALLVHELAHVRRQDFLVNLIQTLAESLLFFHPAARWLSAEIRQEREHCCDDLVVAVTQEPLEYARALAALERRRAATLAPAASAGRLRRRVERLLGGGEPSRRATFPAIVAALAGIAFLVVLAGGLRPSFAGSTQPAETGDDRVAVLQLLLLEVDATLLEELTVRWDGTTAAGVRQGTAEIGTLLREIRRPGFRVFGAPTVRTRLGEAAEISTGDDDRFLSLGMLPYLAEERLALDVALAAALPPAEAVGREAAPAASDAEPARSWLRLALEPGRAAILAAPRGVAGSSSARGEEATAASTESRLAVVVTGALGDAATAPPAPLLSGDATAGQEWRGEPVSLSVRGASLRAMLGSFAAQTGVRVEWRGEGDEVPDRAVTLELQDVPADYALAHLLAASCLVVERQGTVWTASAAPSGHLRLPGGSFVVCP